jgi:hypothetical protein
MCPVVDESVGLSGLSSGSLGCLGFLARPSVPSELPLVGKLHTACCPNGRPEGCVGHVPSQTAGFPTWSASPSRAVPRGPTQTITRCFHSDNRKHQSSLMATSFCACRLRGRCVGFGVLGGASALGTHPCARACPPPRAAMASTDPPSPAVQGGRGPEGRECMVRLFLEE